MTAGTEESGHTGQGPGAMLARERISRGLSIAELSGRLKYAPRQLAALEADDYSKLPGATFVRGMIRAYAKQIGADPAPVLAGFDRRHIPDAVTVDLRTRRIPFPDGRKRATRAYLVLSLVALAAVGAVLVDWHFGSELWSGWTASESATGGGQSALTVSLPMPEIAPAPVPVPVPVQGSISQPEQDVLKSAASTPANSGGTEPRRDSLGGRILLEFQRDSWVEIRDGQGRTILSQLNPGGSHKQVEGNPPFSLIIGNAHGVRLLYNDTQVDLRPYVKVEVARLTLE